MKKIRVALLYGGCSEEHEVSLQSAASVISNLDPDRFEAIPIGIDKEGRWWLGGSEQVLTNSSALTLPDEVQVVLNTQTPHEKQETHQLIPLQQKNKNNTRIDVVFPVLHGPLGEDGTIQGLLELVNLPYVSCGVAASAIAMDKDIAKRLVRQTGMPIVPYLAIQQGHWEQTQTECLDNIMNTLIFPLFVKPANLGSSVGIRKVTSSKDLTNAINYAFQYDTKILVEQAIEGREIEIAVLENSCYGKKPLCSIPGEIIPQHEFYSYEAKYLDENGALLAIPAKLSQHEIEKIQDAAAKIFETLGCEGMSRIDFFLEKDTGQLFFNEANTIPGFTKISMYPKLWEATHIPYQELLSRLIDLAIARHERRKKMRKISSHHQNLL